MRCRFLTILMIALLVRPALADEPAEAEATAPEAAHAAPPLDEACVRAVIAQLGNSDYFKREAAQQQLRDLPPRAMPLIAEQYKATDDPEIAVRLKRFADDYFDRHIMPEFAQRMGWPAFLGIATEAAVTDDGHGAIVARQVIPDTAAQEAGLEDGDVIVKYNGRALPAENTMVMFQQLVRQTGYGARVTLDVLRNGEPLTLTAKLRGVPTDQMSGEEAHARATVRQKLYDRWWNHAFLKGKADLPDDAIEDRELQAARNPATPPDAPGTRVIRAEAAGVPVRVIELPPPLPPQPGE